MCIPLPHRKLSFLLTAMLLMVQSDWQLCRKPTRRHRGKKGCRCHSRQHADFESLKSTTALATLLMMFKQKRSVAILFSLLLLQVQVYTSNEKYQCQNTTCLVLCEVFFVRRKKMGQWGKNKVFVSHQLCKSSHLRWVIFVISIPQLRKKEEENFFIDF